MLHLIKTLTLSCALVAAFGCDKLSPFISDKQFNERIDLDDDGVPNVDDCDPNNQNISKLTFYRDLDGDGYGSKETKLDCAKSKGFVEKTGDCNDNNEKIFPNATETCDLIDNDCDNNTDEGVTPRWYRDKDEDLYGNPNDFRDECTEPVEYISQSGDCNDSSDKIYPEAPEFCDLFDNDCDGETDEDLSVRWYRDKDDDKHGNVNVFEDNCAQPNGYILTNDDCDDEDVATYPEALEICDDKIDQDCDGITDNAENAKLWFADEDSDGSGDPAVSLFACVKPDRHVLTSDDCDDTKSNVNPDVLETCQDKLDNDCDGIIDADAIYVAWYIDADGDGFGDANDSKTSCAPTLEGYVANDTDCDDESSLISPSVEEVCNNGIDDNCDDSPNECELKGTISLTDADKKITGETAEDYAGYSVITEDLNGDGFNDLVVGAVNEGTGGSVAGAVYVLFGPTVSGELSLADADIKLTGESANDSAGHSLAANGDLNGDGFNDLVVGAVNVYTSGSTNGAAYVLFGPLDSGELSLANADVKLTGENAGDYAGWSVASDGDLNGDGFNDLVVGAVNENTGGSKAGATYVLFGPLDSGELSLADADVKLTGETSDDLAGHSLAANGDLNGDGFNDLVVGAVNADTEGLATGAAYVLFSPIVSGELSLADADVKLTGENTGDYA
ncbi:MAG: MopE-related protein, partial [Patescibacteria group bacterium]